jgi:hypothetical protein
MESNCCAGIPGSFCISILRSTSSYILRLDSVALWAVPPSFHSSSPIGVLHLASASTLWSFFVPFVEASSKTRLISQIKREAASNSFPFGGDTQALPTTSTSSKKVLSSVMKPSYLSVRTTRPVVLPGAANGRERSEKLSLYGICMCADQSGVQMGRKIDLGNWQNHKRSTWPDAINALAPSI